MVLQTSYVLYLRQAALDGPVIIVNISKTRSEAIILFPDSRLPVLVCLPDASPQNLVSFFTQLSVTWAGDAVDCSKINCDVL